MKPSAHLESSRTLSSAPNRRRLFARIGLGFLAVWGLAVLPSAGCSQPKVKCTSSARGDFAAKYTLVAGTGPCAELPGDVVGIQIYTPEKEEFRPDFDRGRIALQAASMGDIRARGELSKAEDSANKLYALGDFTGPEPSDDEFCLAPTLAPAAIQLPDLAEVPPAKAGGSPTPAQPATSVRYEWSNLRLLVTPAAIGTQFAADLRVTIDGCSAQYSVAAVYPAHECGKEEVVDGEPQPVVDANGKQLPDDARCAPEANPELGISSGSGISPDFPVVCDPELLLCVLSAPVPAFKPQP